jgi:hypothetical protein
VHFRAAGSEHWYWVDFPAGDACRTATLPKPRQNIAFVEYYLAGTERQLGETRTPRFISKVVRTEAECVAKQPLASFLPKASVQVGTTDATSLFGFSGARLLGVESGMSRRMIAATVVAGSGVVAGIAVLLTRGDAPPEPTPVPTPAARVWQSELLAAGGAGALVVNDAAFETLSAGHRVARAGLTRGENHVRFQLARGGAGQWRFQLGAGRRWDPSRVRVLSGRVSGLTGDAIQFSLEGRPGESAAFSFALAD